ncbi:MAG: hypothetical protein LBC20_03085 [Planctomycetaceae bacterium]|jgi:hypothetical protein|nr:hypothetical protein [Planctomycetaceae bacterium]
MTHELILTSVSQGLVPETSGYCIVAEDQKIPPHLTKRLEALSDYQHLVSSDSEQPPAYPVVYSHLIFPGHDTTWHSLSRIAHAGTDYRSQPNQLAHHIVLTENELVQEGPAWLLLLPSFHITDWLTPSVRFTNGRNIPTLSLPNNLTRTQRIARERRWTDPHKMTLFHSEDDTQETYRIYENDALVNPQQSSCPLWQELTGDSGWAGILAETIQTGQQTTLLFRPGMNILPLIFEAISILPSELHWKATFSTYYFKDLPEHTACQWKGVLANSAMAEQLLKNKENLVLDLTKPLGITPSGKYVEFARTGSDRTLPINEFPENLFLSKDWANNPNLDPISPDPISPEVPAAEPQKIEEISETTPNTPLTVNLPPIITKEVLRIQTQTPKTQNLFHSFLNMKSRGQFYLLYGVTLLLLFILLLLVLDQVMNLGLSRLFVRNNQTNPKAAAASSANPKTIKTKENENPPQNKTDNTTSEEENKTKQKEKQQEQLLSNTAKTTKKLLQNLADTIRSKIEEQKKQIQKQLNEYLSEHLLPNSLAMSVPQFQDDHVNPPESKTFPELMDLYQFGLTLELQFIPLLDIPNVRVETRKQAFMRDINKKDIENEKTSENTDSILSIDLSKDSSLAEFQVPVTDRFEWSVMAIDTDTLQETPMFDLKLTEQGLSVDWRIEGMDAQHLYDTLAASFGFLRVSAENSNENSNEDTNTQSIPLFEPKIQKPISLPESFSDPKQSEVVIEMPFTAEPWRSFWGTTKIPFAFRLDVTVKPDDPEMLQNEGIKSIEVKESQLPSEFFVELLTDVEAPKTVTDKSVTYTSVAIPFEASVEIERVVWHDRSETQMDVLKTEQESNNSMLETMKKELDLVKKDLLVAGNTSPESGELRKKRNELNSEITKMDTRNKDIAHLLNKIPSARERIVKNEQLRFDYSVYLIPVRDNVAESTDATNKIVRLRKEESLLIMKTVTPKQE